MTAAVYIVDPNGRADEERAALERGDLLIADRFVAEEGEDYRFIPGIGWHAWSGAAWRECRLLEHIEAAKGVVRRFLAEGGMDAGRMANTIVQAGRIRGALDLAAADPMIVLAAERLDADPLRLATPGGVVDLSTGVMRPAARHDLVSRLTACAPSCAPSEGWMAFLERVQPDREVREFLQRLVGRSLVGREGPRVLPILVGQGANGKSTFATAIRMVLGEYAHAAPLALLMDVRHRLGGATPELAALRGRRFVIVGESPEDGRLSVERVKALTGGDAITARGLYRDPITFEPTHTVWLATNHRPRVADDGPAVWDRLLLIPWDVRIPEGERVEGLGERLAEHDGPGILRWAVDGAVAYLRDGLHVPDSVRAATNDYRAAEDVFARFLDERTEENPAGAVTAGALLRAYREWSADRPAAPALSDATLRERMQARGFESAKRARVVHYLGIRLVEAER